MAEAIIKTKITADSDQLRRELEAAKQAIDGLRRENDKLHNALGASEGQIKGLRSELSNFSAAGADLQGQLVGMLKGTGALAAGFMTLQTAGEAIRNTIASTQATGDAFAVMMEGAKGATDHFFQSIASGDWSNLISGMREAVRLAEDYAVAMDSAGDAKDALTYIQAKTGADIMSNKAIIEDPDASKADKAKALEGIGRAEQELKIATEHAKEEFRKAAEAAFRKAIGTDFAHKLTEADFIEYSTGYGVGRDAQFNAYKSRVDELEQRAKARTSVRGIPIKTEDAKTAERELEAYKAQNRVLEEKRQILNRLTDAERQEVVSKFGEAYAAQTALATAQITENRLKRKLDRQDGAAARDAAKNQIYPEGTIARAEQDLKALQDKLTKTTSTTMRALLRDQIKELQDIIAEMQTGQPRGSNKARQLLAINALEGDEPGSAQETWHGGIYSAVQKRKTPIKLSTEAPKGLDPAKMRKIKSPYDLYIKGVKEAKEANEALSDSMGLVGDALGTVGNAVGGSAGDMLRWGATLLQTIAKVMPQIAAITAAEGKRTIVSSAASSAFGGPVAVAASVASVMGVLASIPKFERGGIVGGSSYYGDKILARVNSGELIANSDQQRRIWQQMQEGRAEIQTNVNVGGEFRLRGSDLVAVVERATRKHNR